MRAIDKNTYDYKSEKFEQCLYYFHVTITWEHIKQFLYSHNRVEELCNKETSCEILTLWNGLMLCKWSPDSWINNLWRSGRSQQITELGTNKIIGEIKAPTKTINNQLKLF